ncbi:MAG: ABC transporter permease [Asticcacaulis sp.]
MIKSPVRYGRALGDTLNYLWGGWSGLAALCVLAALWQAGHEVLGGFILPSPAAVMERALALIQTPDSRETVVITLYRALTGLAWACLAGISLGLMGGYLPSLMRLIQPLVIILLGIPPIAWIVIIMIGFGSSDTSIILTVALVCSPLVLIGTAEGVMTRDRRLDSMAKAYGAGPIQRALGLGMRQVTSALFAPISIAAGTAVKIAIMSELLTNSGGIGTALGSARTLLDMTEALAWMVLAVSSLLLFEFGLIRPVRDQTDQWRIVHRHRLRPPP